MILADAVAEKLRSLLAEMPSWKSLVGSQFVNQLSIFQGWAVEDAVHKIERARHEGFIDTALNRSSIPTVRAWNTCRASQFPRVVVYLF